MSPFSAAAAGLRVTDRSPADAGAAATGGDRTTAVNKATATGRSIPIDISNSSSSLASVGFALELRGEVDADGARLHEADGVFIERFSHRYRYRIVYPALIAHIFEEQIHG